MDPLESIPDLAQPVAGCQFAAQLSAYHDGELDAAASARLEQHLASCDACRAELEDIGELSSLADQVGLQGMSASGLRKIHRLVDADQGYSVFRIAGVLTGLAASAMVIGAVWLSEVPVSQPKNTIVIIPSEDSRRWDNVAINLRFDPLPQSDLDVRNQPMYADARLAQWMVDSLTGSAR